MSATPATRASDLAAQQVEQIVGAAQAAAEEIRNEARAERQEIRETAQREAEDAREKARRETQEDLTHARKQALIVGNDALREAECLLDDAGAESAQLREKTQAAVAGRVAAAERAAAEVLEEARALSGGLRQLGKTLEDQAGRILRDVEAAHKRMQADLRVGAGPPSPDPLHGLAETIEDEAPAGRRSRSEPPRRAPARAPSSTSDESETPRSRRPNPFEELEVPSWVRRED